MTLQEAIVKSIREYYNGTSFEEYEKTTGTKNKFNLEYFQGVEDEFINTDPKKKGVSVDEETSS